MTEHVYTLLNKVNDSFTVNMYDNGFMLEVSGRAENEYRAVKLVFTDRDQLMEEIDTVLGMERDV